MAHLTRDQYEEYARLDVVGRERFLAGLCASEASRNFHLAKADELEKLINQVSVPIVRDSIDEMTDQELEKTLKAGPSIFKRIQWFFQDVYSGLLSMMRAFSLPLTFVLDYSFLFLSIFSLVAVIFSGAYCRFYDLSRNFLLCLFSILLIWLFGTFFVLLFFREEQAGQPSIPSMSGNLLRLFLSFVSLFFVGQMYCGGWCYLPSSSYIVALVKHGVVSEIILSDSRMFMPAPNFFEGDEIKLYDLVPVDRYVRNSQTGTLHRPGSVDFDQAMFEEWSGRVTANGLTMQVNVSASLQLKWDGVDRAIRSARLAENPLLSARAELRDSVNETFNQFTKECLTRPVDLPTLKERLASLQNEIYCLRGVSVNAVIIPNQ